jgi:hypothetical protein
MRHLQNLFVPSLLFTLSSCADIGPIQFEEGEEPEPELAEQQQALDTQGFFEARGYYMNTDRVAGDCIESATGGPVKPVQLPNTGGQTVSWSLRLLESSADVQEALSISASASADFLIGGGGAKFNFAETTQTSETSVTLLASMTVTNTSWTMPPGIKLTSSALSLLRGVAGAPPSAAQLARFRQRCGDGFLHSYTTGGQYFAMIQVHTSSLEEKQAISAHIEGHYLTFEAEADFSKEMQKYVSNSSTTVRTYQIGGEGAGASACSDVTCVKQRVASFTQSVKDKPVVFKSTVKPYSILALPSDAQTPADIAITLNAMEQINRQRNSVRDQMTRLLDAQTYPEKYTFASGSPLSNLGAALGTSTANMNKLNDALKVCGRTPASCAMPNLATVSYTPPKLKPMADKVMLRSYVRPSLIATYGPVLASCTGTRSFGREVKSRAEADIATFKVVPSLIGEPGAVSFQSLTRPTEYLVINASGDCRARASMLVPTSATLKERATFHRVRGLNGMPNTSSFRLYATSDAEGVGSSERNRNPELYLSIQLSNNAILVYGRPDASATAEQLEGWKDKSSFYVDAQ